MKKLSQNSCYSVFCFCFDWTNILLGSEEMNRKRNEVANRIRVERETQHLTREAFEERSGISAKYLYEVEMAKKDITTTILLKICQALHTTPNYILLGERNREWEAISLLKQMDDTHLHLSIAILKTILEESTHAQNMRKA